ncbi:MAG: PHP domain-containing protein [Prochloraceae cyanobacterium]|nr:PHP domain-containing protein [Prochloraceae cyanobacterium]
MVATNINKPAAQNSLVLKQVLENIQPDSCPHSYNFHLHTIFSDGQLTPSGLMEQAMSIGLKGLAITDHHSVLGYKAAQSWLESTRINSPQTPLPHLWTGVEINGDILGTEVHILGYSFDPEYPGLQPYLQGKTSSGRHYLAENVISTIQKAGGIAVLAHPARYPSPAEMLIPAAVELGIDGVEAYYAYGNPKPWRPSPRQTQQIKQLSEQYGVFFTCGTDTHGLNLRQRI